MNKYQNGDRIIMTKSVCYAKKNMIGTIRGFDMNYAIEFDKDFVGGHDCSGLVKSKRGHWVTEDSFELYHEDNIEVGDKVELIYSVGSYKKGFKGIVQESFICSLWSDFNIKITDCGSYPYEGYICIVSRSDIRLVEKHIKAVEPHDWNISITPNGDKTTLLLTVDGEKKEYTVKRYEEDTYSIEAAVRALVDKVFKKETIEKKPDLYLKRDGLSGDCGKIGSLIYWCDKLGNPLYVGDVVKIFSNQTTHTYQRYITNFESANLINGIVSYCDDKTGEIKTWTVEKIKDYSMVQIGDRIGNIKVISR